MMNAVDEGSSPVPQFSLTLPTRAIRRRFPTAWRFALLLLILPASAHAQEFDPPLITSEARRDFERNKQRQYQTALQSANPSDAEQQLLREGAQYHLYGLTLAELRKELPVVTDDLMNDLYSGLASENARRVICQEVVNRAIEFLPPQPNEPGDLDGNRLGQPHVVRLNLAIMLRRLNVRPSDARQGAIPFVPARTALLLILNDPGNTRTDARIWAAEGLGRICDAAVAGVPDGDLSIVPRAEIGVALCNAMQTPHAQNDRTHFYPMQIMDSLGDCGLSQDAVGNPVMIETLINCLANPQEHDLVRSTAALSISRLGRINEANGLGGGVNYPLIIQKTMEYGHELAAELQAGNGNVHTRRAIMNLYFAFKGLQPTVAAEQKIGFSNQVLRAGLGQHTALVQGAYDAILPVFQEVASNPTPNIAPDMVQGLSDWIGANPVTDTKITPSSDPLPEPDATAAPEPDPAPEPCPVPDLEDL